MEVTQFYVTYADRVTDMGPLGHQVVMVKCVPYVARLIIISCLTLTLKGWLFTNEEQLKHELARPREDARYDMTRVEKLRDNLAKDEKVVAMLESSISSKREL